MPLIFRRKHMVTIVRSNSDDPHFRQVVKSLDADLAERDGKEHGFYDQFNKLDKIRHALTAYITGEPVASGAMKEFEPGTMEIKRMFVYPEKRGQGIGTAVLKELEKWAKELSYRRCVLETGKKQPEAIALYLSNGYYQIENYGQYAGIDNSVCFEKWLTD